MRWLPKQGKAILVKWCLRVCLETCLFGRGFPSRWFLLFLFGFWVCLYDWQNSPLLIMMVAETKRGMGLRGHLDSHRGLCILSVMSFTNILYFKPNEMAAETPCRLCCLCRLSCFARLCRPCRSRRFCRLCRVCVFFSLVCSPLFFALSLLSITVGRAGGMARSVKN